MTLRQSLARAIAPGGLLILTALGCPNGSLYSNPASATAQPPSPAAERLPASAAPSRAPTGASPATAPPGAPPGSPRNAAPSAPVRLQVLHRAGQTFLTWPELDASRHARYRLYRALKPINGLEGLTPLAVVSGDSGAYPRQVELKSPFQKRFIIEERGAELPPGTGLYVHTPHPRTPVPAWYAVEVVIDGQAQPLEPRYLLSQPVQETDDAPQPVLIHQSPEGLQRLYTQWMDDTRWNGALEGYAYNFWVGLPAGVHPAPLPLTLHLHAWGESWMRFFDSGRQDRAGTPYNFQTVWLEPDDPSNTWWMGFADRMNAEGAAAADATVRPYTEARLEWLLTWLTSPRSGVRIDRDRIYLYGGSMGGSGTLSFGLRHPEWFAALYALLPMTNSRASIWGRAGLTRLWGPLQPPLKAPDAPDIQSRMDMVRFLEAHQGDDLPFTVTVHGRTDTTIEWPTQGQPWLEARERTGQPGPGLFTDGDHSSVFDSYTGDLIPNFKPTDFRIRRTDSYPVFTAFTGDDDPGRPLPACRSEDPVYRYGYRGGGIRWGGTGQTVLGQSAPTDTADRYEIALAIRADLCALPRQGTTTVTLRRRQQFRPPEGAVLGWEVLSASGGKLQSGTVKVGPGSRISIPKVPVSQEGTVLRVRQKQAAGQPESRLPSGH